MSDIPNTPSGGEIPLKISSSLTPSTQALLARYAKTQQTNPPSTGQIPPQPQGTSIAVASSPPPTSSVSSLASTSARDISSNASYSSTASDGGNRVTSIVIPTTRTQTHVSAPVPLYEPNTSSSLGSSAAPVLSARLAARLQQAHIAPPTIPASSSSPPTLAHTDTLSSSTQHVTDLPSMRPLTAPAVRASVATASAASLSSTSTYSSLLPQQRPATATQANSTAASGANDKAAGGGAGSGPHVSTYTNTYMDAHPANNSNSNPNTARPPSVSVSASTSVPASASTATLSSATSSYTSALGASASSSVAALGPSASSSSATMGSSTSSSIPTLGLSASLAARIAQRTGTTNPANITNTTTNDTSTPAPPPSASIYLSAVGAAERAHTAPAAPASRQAQSQPHAQPPLQQQQQSQVQHPQPQQLQSPQRYISMAARTALSPHTHTARTPATTALTHHTNTVPAASTTASPISSTDVAFSPAASGPLSSSVTAALALPATNTATPTRAPTHASPTPAHTHAAVHTTAHSAHPHPPSSPPQPQPAPSAAAASAPMPGGSPKPTYTAMRSRTRPDGVVGARSDAVAGNTAAIVAPTSTSTSAPATTSASTPATASTPAVLRTGEKATAITPEDDARHGMRHQVRDDANVPVNTAVSVPMDSLLPTTAVSTASTDAVATLAALAHALAQEPSASTASRHVGDPAHSTSESADTVAALLAVDPVLSRHGVVDKDGVGTASTSLGVSTSASPPQVQPQPQQQQQHSSQQRHVTVPTAHLPAPSPLRLPLRTGTALHLYTHTTPTRHRAEEADDDAASNSGTGAGTGTGGGSRVSGGRARSRKHAHVLPSSFALFLALALPTPSAASTQANGGSNTLANASAGEGTGTGALTTPLCLPLPLLAPLAERERAHTSTTTSTNTVSTAVDTPQHPIFADFRTFASPQPFTIIPLSSRAPASAGLLCSGDAVLLLSAATGHCLAVQRTEQSCDAVLLPNPLTTVPPRAHEGVGADNAGNNSAAEASMGSRSGSVTAYTVAPAAVWVLSCPAKRTGDVLHVGDPLLLSAHAVTAPTTASTGGAGATGLYLAPTLFTDRFSLETGIADGLIGSDVGRGNAGGRSVGNEVGGVALPPPASTTSSASSLSLLTFIPSLYWYAAPATVPLAHLSSLILPPAHTLLPSLAAPASLAPPPQLPTLAPPHADALVCDGLLSTLLGQPHALFAARTVTVPNTLALSYFTANDLSVFTSTPTPSPSLLAHPHAHIDLTQEPLSLLLFTPSTPLPLSAAALAARVLALAASLAFLRAEAALRSLPHLGAVSHAFAASLHRYVRDAGVLVCALEARLRQRALTTLNLSSALQPLATLTAKLAVLLAHPARVWQQHGQHAGTYISNASFGGLPPLPRSRVLTGGPLLSCLYVVCVCEGDMTHQQLFARMLSATAHPYLRMLHRWMREGVCDDPYHEFFLRAPVFSPLDTRELTSVSTHTRLSRDDSMLPCFLHSVATAIAEGGLHALLTRLCGGDISPLERAAPAHTLTFDNAATAPLTASAAPTAVSLSGLTLALSRSCSLAASLCTQTFMRSLDIMGRLRSLRGFMLLCEGDFFTQFTELAGSELAKDHTLASWPRLQTLLSLAVKTSNARWDPHRHLLSCGKLVVDGNGNISQSPQLPSQASTSTSTATTGMGAYTAMDVFCLQWRCEWPASLIIGSQSLLKYTSIFRHLFFCRHVRTQLVSCFRALQALKDMSVQRALARSNALRQRMLHFALSLEQYLLSSVLGVEWVEMEAQMRQADSLVAVAHAHDAFLDRCSQRCLLSCPAALQPLVKLLTYSLLFADNMQRFVLTIEPTAEELLAALQAFDTRHRALRSARGLSMRPLSESQRRAVRSEVRARKVQHIVTHAHYTNMVQRFASSFDDKVKSFLALARERGQSRGDAHLLDLLGRLDYNGYYSARQ